MLVVLENTTETIAWSTTELYTRQGFWCNKVTRCQVARMCGVRSYHPMPTYLWDVFMGFFLLVWSQLQ